MPQQRYPKFSKPTLTKYIHRVWELMRSGFSGFLRIAQTQQHLIQVSAIDWAHAHTSILLCGEYRQLSPLIKHMCDTQEPYDSSTDFEDWIFWRSWRAPLLVHMLPMGNTLYDHARAWDREDKDKTEETLDGLRRHILMGVVFGIERTVTKLHIEQAASTPFNPKSTPNTVTKAMLTTTAAGTPYSFRELEQKFKECRIGKVGHGFPRAWVSWQGKCQIGSVGTAISDYCALAARAMGYAGDDPQEYWVKYLAAQKTVKKRGITTTSTEDGTHTNFVIEDLADASAHVCRLLMARAVGNHGYVAPSAEKRSDTPRDETPNVPIFTHSDDYRSITFNGRPHTLTERQALVVKALHEPLKQGKSPFVAKRAIEQLPGFDTGVEMRDVFKSRIHLWGTLVLSGDTVGHRGFYRLNESITA